MKNPNVSAKKASAAISKVRKEQKKFTYDELLFGLRLFKCPYPVAVISILVNLEIIKKELGIYKFTKSRPVYYGCLKPGLIAKSNTTSKYNITYKESRTKKIVEELQDEYVNYTNFTLLQTLK